MTVEQEPKNTLTALIIDDENDICFLLSNILRNDQLKVKYVHSINEGKAALKHHEPNILFLDNHLPDGFGVDFIRYIKNTFPAIKIVMVTAHDTPEDRKKALLEGADHFISKPFSTVEIKAVIKQLFPQKINQPG